MNGFCYLCIVIKNINVWIFSMYCSPSKCYPGQVPPKKVFTTLATKRLTFFRFPAAQRSPLC